MAQCPNRGALPRNKLGDKPGHFPALRASSRLCDKPATKNAFRAAIRSGGCVQSNVYTYQGDYAQGYHHRWRSSSVAKGHASTVFDRGTTDTRQEVIRGKLHRTMRVLSTINR